jgi:hypothetical protein
VQIASIVVLEPQAYADGEKDVLIVSCPLAPDHLQRLRETVDIATRGSRLRIIFHALEDQGAPGGLHGD